MAAILKLTQREAQLLALYFQRLQFGVEWAEEVLSLRKKLQPFLPQPPPVNTEDK